MDCSPPGSSVHGILQTRILEWAAMPSSRGPSWPRDWTQVFCIAGGFLLRPQGSPQETYRTCLNVQDGEVTSVRHGMHDYYIVWTWLVNKGACWQFLLGGLENITKIRGCCCSVAQSCPTLCHPVDWSMPGFPVLHHLLEFAQKGAWV